jgi:hypothetical protein
MSKNNNKGKSIPANDNNKSDSTLSNFKEMGEMYKEIKEKASSLDNEEKEKLLASLEKDTKALVDKLNKTLAERNSLKEQTKQKLESARNQKNVVDKKEKELSKGIQQLQLDRQKISKQQADQAKRLRELEEKSLDAESGFAKKNMKMLEDFKSDKLVVASKLEEEKERLEKSIEELKFTEENLTEENKKYWQRKLTELKNKEDELSGREFKLERDCNDLKLKFEHLESIKENDKKILEESVRSEVSQQLSSLENQKANLEQQIEKYQKRESELLNQLSAFKEIERQLNGDTPQQLLKELAASKLEISDLKEELDAKPSDQLEDSYKILQKECNELYQRYQDSQVKLQEKTTLLYKNQNSVVELEQREKQKQAISKHNELLSVRLNDLKDEVDELLNKQQSKTAFPTLLKLDSSLRSEAVTESVPNLSDFILELQHRIAWDAKEEKELYYRKEDIQLFIAGLAMSPLHVLQGISGTGKTSLPKAFARAMGAGNKIIPVQAGWRDKTDLIGHYNTFEKKFYEEETLQGLYEAQCPAFKDRLYIILLDEMNLSRPEQYFSEFLSALELEPKERNLTLMTTGQSGGPKLLDDGRVIKIPRNVWFIGTANLDETTFQFADKTLDRAHVMELLRHKVDFKIDKSLVPVTYSFSSLEKVFSKACSKHQDKVKDLVKAMDKSEFLECLKNEFAVSWGNRFERHMERFIPVILECGGDLGFAVDHLIATKVLRKGKVTDRYDTKRSDIEDLKDYIEQFWKEQKFRSKPIACFTLLEQDLKKKSNS